MRLQGSSHPWYGDATAAHGSQDIQLQDCHPTDTRGDGKIARATVNDLSMHIEVEEQDDRGLSATLSTRKDAEDMKRMGKEQQLVRQFRLMSIASFVAIATATWEIGLITIGQSFVDGGRPGLLYSTLWNFICFAPIYLSMAEMASIAPIAGAQYHWCMIAVNDQNYGFPA
ncbi:hypothetical protein LTR86_003509 [Recurvomyces mirabilis]|nr:hypothetical protein LTR86_003509 [Recurvomyces mirabilis]